MTAAGGDVVKVVNEESFQKEVVEASGRVPILVDFWRRGVVLAEP